MSMSELDLVFVLDWVDVTITEICVCTWMRKGSILYIFDVVVLGFLRAYFTTATFILLIKLGLLEICGLNLNWVGKA